MRTLPKPRVVGGEILPALSVPGKSSLTRTTFPHSLHKTVDNLSLPMIGPDKALLNSHHLSGKSSCTVHK